MKIFTDGWNPARTSALSNPLHLLIISQGTTERLGAPATWAEAVFTGRVRTLSGQGCMNNGFSGSYRREQEEDRNKRKVRKSDKRKTSHTFIIHVHLLV